MQMVCGQLLLDSSGNKGLHDAHMLDSYQCLAHLQGRKEAGAHPFTAQAARMNGSCAGTHAVAYSAVNKQ